MTTKDLHIAFKVLLDKNAENVAYGGCPAFLDEEVDIFLNQAYLQVVAQKFTGNNTIQQGFEASVKRTADLERLVKTDHLVPLVRSFANVLELKDAFTKDKEPEEVGDQGEDNQKSKRLYFVSARLLWGLDQDAHEELHKPKDLIREQIGIKTAPVGLVNHNVAQKFLMSHNNHPYIPTPIATMEDDTLLIYVDPYKMLTTDNQYFLDLTYVKYPAVIDHTKPADTLDNLPDSVMDEVVNRAVLIALDNIEAPRTQQKSQINTLQE